MTDDAGVRAVQEVVHRARTYRDGGRWAATQAEQLVRKARMMPLLPAKVLAQRWVNDNLAQYRQPFREDVTERLVVALKGARR